MDSSLWPFLSLTFLCLNNLLANPALKSCQLSMNLNNIKPKFNFNHLLSSYYSNFIGRSKDTIKKKQPPVWELLWPFFYFFWWLLLNLDIFFFHTKSISILILFDHYTCFNSHTKTTNKKTNKWPPWRSVPTGMLWHPYNII